MESISFLDPYDNSIILSDEISSQVDYIMCTSSEFFFAKTLLIAIALFKSNVQIVRVKFPKV